MGISDKAELENLGMELFSKRKGAELGAGLEGEGEGEAVGKGGSGEQLVIEEEGLERVTGVEVGADEGVVEEGGWGVWEGGEEFGGMGKGEGRVGREDGVELGEAAGVVGVEGLGGLDDECVDLVSFMDVGAELEKRKVWMLLLVVLVLVL